jgi:hypothetical protein
MTFSYPVEIKASKIQNAGRGVFATADIAKNKEPCFYDGYKLPADQNMTIQEQRYNLEGVVGYAEPKSTGGIAQLINDSACIKVSNEETLKSLAEKSLLYLMGSKNQSNVVTNGTKIITAREIKAGEELYLQYGVVYWLADAYYETNNMQTAQLISYFVSLLDFIRKQKRNMEDAVREMYHFPDSFAHFPRPELAAVQIAKSRSEFLLVVYGFS